ncbi:MAG TPA: FAD-dependent oxidoreductase [Ignavibacteriales bacterium]|nr:FAD-dependent oxidoreductase [Ignavibacteriales bacterium]
MSKFFLAIVTISLLIIISTFVAYERVEISDFSNNNSYWVKSESLSVNPALNTNLKVDIAIIGGGYTGLSSAYHLAKMNPNLKIVVFEAKTLGSGASGRHGGMILPTLLDEYEDEKTFKLTYDLSVKNMHFIDSLSKAFNIDCNLVLNGYCETIYRKEDVQKYKDYVEEANKAGIPLEFWNKQKTQEKLGTGLYYGAIFDPNGGSVHAVKLIKLLKTAAESQGVIIYENSPVVSISEGKNIIITVETSGISYHVEAKDIVITTNAYTSKLGIFKNKIMPVHTQCAVTKPLTQSQLNVINWSSRLPFYDNRFLLFHLVLTPDNRIVIGGGNIDIYWNNGLKYKGNLAKVADMLLDELVYIYPELKGIKFEYVWDGIIGITYDEVPTLGVMGKYNNIYYGLGYNGHGVNQSILYGDVIAHLYSGKYHGWEDTEYYGYELSNIPPEPFKFIGSNLLINYWKWKYKH